MSRPIITNLLHAAGSVSRQFQRMSRGFFVSLLVLAMPITTSGQASVQTTITSIPWEETATLSCIGEVTVSGVFRVVDSVRLDSAMGSHWASHFLLTNLRAFDANGNEWTGVHTGQISFNPNSCETPPNCGSTPFETSFITMMLFAGHGDAPNLRVATRFHAVFNANGELTVFFDVIDATCGR